MPARITPTQARRLGLGSVSAPAKRRPDLEGTLYRQIELAGLPLPRPNYKFHPERKWRLDLCWPERRWAVEIEGGVWTGGRHTRGKGFTSDCEKYNMLALLGCRLLRVTGDTIKSGAALKLIEEALNL